ncbi:uncharacterized protein BYT42DRAFT_495151 [Radiomyces spectabilis]|uniref:uncharacterized protein n=1 Tax=Radiomyces spectabilis TaxID=64574 RepID=UPI00221FD8D0|nr:uncharacterized protein BYT42DRAFT_495151 [Radiomyces spectabilis]KAI8380961.1 hypothetical protein BYT42DRAFT_495151 [Radiomyces spectabilis]
MSQRQPTLYTQLSTANFAEPDSDSDDASDAHEAAIVPLSTRPSQPTTVRVTRPTAPADFMLQRQPSSQKDLLDLAFRPAALNTRVTCQICRSREGLDKLHPQYQLFIEHIATGEMQHIMTARKERKSQTSYYTITGVVHDDNAAPQSIVLGKVRQVA